MAERHNGSENGADDKPTVNRRTVLQATAATGMIPVVGRASGGAPGRGDAPDVPDLMVANLDTSARTVTLELDGGAADGDAGFFGGSPRTTLHLAPDSDETIEDLATAFDGIGPSNVAESGTASLAVADDAGAAETLSIDADLSDSNRIVDVLVDGDGIALATIHYDAVGPAAGPGGQEG